MLLWLTKVTSISLNTQLSTYSVSIRDYLMTTYSPYHSQVEIILALTERILSSLTSSWNCTTAGKLYALPRACSSTELCFASVVSSLRGVGAWSVEEGAVTSVVLDSVSLFTSSASWANLSLDSLGDRSWSSRKSWSSATEGTSRDSSPCPPSLA